MPRSIQVPTGDPSSFAAYTLSANEEWTLLAVSCSFDANGHNDPYGYPIFQWTDAAGGVIYRQQMNTLLNDLVGVSAAADGEPWYVSNNGAFGFPQATDQQTNATMSIRLPQIALTPGDTFGIYALQFAISMDENPLDLLSPYHDVSVANLRVEDSGNALREHVTVGPYMLVPGQNA